MRASWVVWALLATAVAGCSDARDEDRTAVAVDAGEEEDPFDMPDLTLTPGPAEGTTQDLEECGERFHRLVQAWYAQPSAWGALLAPAPQGSADDPALAPAGIAFEWSHPDTPDLRNVTLSSLKWESDGRTVVLRTWGDTTARLWLEGDWPRDGRVPDDVQDVFLVLGGSEEGPALASEVWSAWKKAQNETYGDPEVKVQDSRLALADAFQAIFGADVALPPLAATDEAFMMHEERTEFKEAGWTWGIVVPIRSRGLQEPPYVSVWGSGWGHVHLSYLAETPEDGTEEEARGAVERMGLPRPPSDWHWETSGC